jgi:ribonuclease-3
MTTQDIEQVLGLKFNNKHLLEEAFTHKSYTNENANSTTRNYERLEFLGDAVLDFVTAELLYTRFPDLSEGELTRLRSALVKMDTLAELGRQLGFGPLIRMGKGEVRSGGRERASTLGRVFEALIGALYLDSGLESVRAFVIPHLSRLQEQLMQEALAKDARTRLQEWSQALHGLTPTYTVLSVEGPDHNRTYQVEVRLGDDVLAQGTGRSILLASQNAAVIALQRVSQNPPSG